MKSYDKSQIVVPPPFILAHKLSHYLSCILSSDFAEKFLSLNHLSPHLFLLLLRIGLLEQQLGCPIRVQWATLPPVSVSQWVVDHPGGELVQWPVLACRLQLIVAKLIQQDVHMQILDYSGQLLPHPCVVASINDPIEEPLEKWTLKFRH